MGTTRWALERQALVSANQRRSGVTSCIKKGLQHLSLQLMDSSATVVVEDRALTCPSYSCSLGRWLTRVSAYPASPANGLSCSCEATALHWSGHQHHMTNVHTKGFT